jgi:hypothetical protein
LFHRSWTQYNGGTSGGQLKVRDAFEHIRASDRFEPFVYFPPETVWFDNPGNYWLPYRKDALTAWEIRPSDILFFAGYDWKILSPETAVNPPVPVLNIAQPRHTLPGDPRHAYLQFPAIRIAKSTIGKKILEAYGVNGPVHLIPDAIDFSQLPEANPEPDLDILIVGLKNPELATRLQKKLERTNRWRMKRWKIAVQVPPKLPTRADFLALVNRAKILVFLPLDAERGAEGFYLPALEAMAMNKLVICPYAVGNIDFCIPGETCLQPEYNETALHQAVLDAMGMTVAEREKMSKAGNVLARKHDIRFEKERLLSLLHQADDIWKDLSLFKTRR